ncbi:hypothetical protein K701_07095 [Streptomyces fradiae ATCC 10745 = DSM 40063]|uniref:Uncharacterized protein n=1 Tax=Streptomyces fradiae ATCC 10745 = DSM 40063 TaxID=1319510 RepID=A0ABQ6XYC4_STRFR|nr:hypothetical protein K701_07095 [Streptomyces fradiae ATCC 10745 = DSM 40063]QEV13469.1 hypothetical protein CP974_17400 [Streptomyces fradiae ATCC 10745 = DSM 40063]
MPAGAGSDLRVFREGAVDAGGGGDCALAVAFLAVARGTVRSGWITRGALDVVGDRTRSGVVFLVP